MLVTRFKNGSKKAFDELYKRYSKTLLNLMFHLLNRDEALAQDLLHDVFVRLIEFPEKFDTSRNFKSWIFTVATNECRKQYRRPPNQSLEDVDENDVLESNCVVNNLDQAQFKQMLAIQLKELSFEQRSCFVLRYQEKLSIKEISDVLNCAEGTVKSRLHYTTKLLSNKLAIFNPLESI